MWQFDGGGGNKKAQEIAGIRRRRQIGTDLQEFDGGGEQSLTWSLERLLGEPLTTKTFWEAILW
jgi:hypothetical protein